MIDMEKGVTGMVVVDLRRGEKSGVVGEGMEIETTRGVMTAIRIELDREDWMKKGMSMESLWRDDKDKGELIIKAFK